MNRREFLRTLFAVGIFTGVGGAALYELLAKGLQATPQVINQPPTQQNTNTTQPPSTQGGNQTSSGGTPSGYVYVAPVSALGSKTSAYFSHPTYGLSILVYYSGAWKAFSAVCTHAGCTVDYTGSSLYCPCHAGSFNPSNGAVTAGPPPSPLPQYGVLIQNGNLYVTSSAV